MKWREERVRLSFRLGERTLGRVHLPLMVGRESFPPRTCTDRIPPAAVSDLPAHLRGVLYRSWPIRGTLARISIGPAAIRYVPQQYERYYTNMHMTFEQYMGSFSSRTRSTLRRKVRRFTEHSGGTLRWRLFRRPDEMGLFHEQARMISARTYQERLLDAGLPDDQEFCEEMIRRAGRDDVRAFILYHGQQPIAYLYCPVQDNVLQYAYLGYDPKWSAWSPGTVLQYCAMEALFAEQRFDAFDFGEGSGQHKRLFATGSVSCADVYFFRPTMPHRLLVRLHAQLDAFATGAGRLLERLRLKAYARRLMRAAG